MHLSSSKETPTEASKTNDSVFRAAVLEIARELGSTTVSSFVNQATWKCISGSRLTLNSVSDGLQDFHLQARPISQAQIKRWVRPGNIAIGIADQEIVVISNGSRKRVREAFVDSTAVSRRWMQRRQLSRTFAESPYQWLAITKSQDLDDMASAGVKLPPWQRLRAIARIERRDISIVATYAATLGLLSLIIPIATQAVVNTVAFGAVLQPMVVLTVALSFGLAIAGGLSVLQAYIVEVFQRRILVRFAEDLGARIPKVALHARDAHDLVELNNRFLDVISIQKSSAELLLVGLGLALQTGVGLLLLGFYHPALMLFALLLCGGIVLVTLLGRGGTKSAIAESKSKFAIVAWLDELARAPQLFAGGQGCVMAAERTTEKVHAYVSARRNHYRHVFAVLVGGATLQVIAFVSLLGVGGYLVIERQLTLGQLVAAEIVVGAIAIGIGKMGRLADKTFDLVAATDKLGVLLDLPLREHGSDTLPEMTKGVLLQVENLKVDSIGSRMPAFSLQLQFGQKMWLSGAPGIGKSLLLQTLAGHREAKSGYIAWQKRSSPTADALSEAVFLASDEALIGGTIFDNLRLSNAQLKAPDAWNALDSVGLSEIVDQLGGLETKIHGASSSLSSSQRRRLILARALIAQPRLLLIDGTLDFLGENNSQITNRFLGAGAPWAAIVVTNDPTVSGALFSKVHASEGGMV